MELVQSTNNNDPVALFPEGKTTNGKFISTFKKGVFVPEMKIKPLVLKLHDSSFSPAFDIIEILPMLILLNSWGFTKYECLTFPDFEPTEYLFTTHADKGTERWEIFAWAVRDAMMKGSGLGSDTVTYREKQVYEKFMQKDPRTSSYTRVPS